MTFYAITLDGALNSLGGSLYSGALLGALVELPAYAEISPRYIAEIYYCNADNGKMLYNNLKAPAVRYRRDI